MKKTICILILGLFHMSFLMAQDENDDVAAEAATPSFMVDADIHFSSVIPLGNLKGNMDAGYGLGVTAIFGRSDFPLMAGASFNFHWHNNVSTDLLIYNGSFDEEHDMTTSSYSMNGDVIIRAEPYLDFPIIPFADAFFGFNRFSTWTNISGEDEYEDDPDLDNFNSFYREAGDWTWTYGFGAGLKIKLFDSGFADEPIVMLKLRAAYRKGGIADYLVKRDEFDIIDSTLEAFEEKRSTTDMLMLELGVTFKMY